MAISRRCSKAPDRRRRRICNTSTSLRPNQNLDLLRSLGRNPNRRESLLNNRYNVSSLPNRHRRYKSNSNLPIRHHRNTNHSPLPSHRRCRSPYTM